MKSDGQSSSTLHRIALVEVCRTKATKLQVACASAMYRWDGDGGQLVADRIVILLETRHSGSFR